MERLAQITTRSLRLQVARRITTNDALHLPSNRVGGSLALTCASVAINGCSRTKYRLQADREAYHAIAERNVDPRWCAD